MAKAKTTSKEGKATKEEQHPSTEVPEASPDENQKSTVDNKKASSSSSSPNRRLLWGVGALFLVIVIVLAITLPLTLKDDSSDDGSSSGSGSNPLGTNPGEDDDPNTTTDNSNPNSSSGIPLFSKDITAGYTDKAGFESDLTLALTHEAMGYIDQQVLNSQNQYYYGDEETDTADGESMRPEAEGGADGTGAMPPPEAGATMDQSVMEDGGDTAEGVSDYETNNQEENVQEADIIKSDANFVYASYGDYILVWDTDGNQVAQVQMPEVELPEGWGENTGVPYYDEEEPMDDMDMDGATGGTTGGSDMAEEEPVVATAKSMMMPGYGFRRPKANVQSLLLTDNHLVAIVTGYNDPWYHYGYGGYPQDRSEMPALSNYQGSQIRLYSKTGDGNLVFVGSRDINGYPVDARSIGDQVHIATASRVDTYQHLWDPLNRYQFDKGLTDEQYRIQATTLAEQQLIPDLTRKLTQELGLEEGELPKILQINQWMTTPIDLQSDNDEEETSTTIIDPTVYDVVQNVAMVTSFDVNAAVDANELLTTSSSIYMAPNAFNTLYGTTEHLVLATQGWDWNADTGNSEQTTYLVALQVHDNATTSFISVGTLRGHLLNQYALDIVDNELRAATTIDRQQWWWGGPGGPMPFEGDMVVMEDAAVEGRQGNGCPAVDDPCMNEDNLDDCLVLLEEGCPNIMQLESCPLQFACQLGEPGMPPESRTSNYMIVMNLIGETANQMDEKGRVEVGEPNERIMSVRFFDNIAYVVTFERTDPFYVVDMSVPEVLGELKLPGFSSYLHSMNPPENTMLVAVGQNATSDGRTTGVMVTVFDATDPANPIDVVSHTFATSTEEGETNAYTSSDIEWDYKAFRLVDGKLIMPMDIWYQQEWDPQTGMMIPLPEGVENFQGFVVLDITDTSIEEQYRISHTRGPGYCYYCEGGYLPTRSFVHNGALMTIRGNRVISTILESGDPNWMLDLAVQGESRECCSSGYY